MSKSLYKDKRFGRDGISSNSSSRAASVSRTPLRSDDSDYETDEENELIKIDELLREKLTSLQQQEIGETSKEDRIGMNDRRQYEASNLNKARIQESSSINEIIISLTFSRSDVSSQSRELLLAQLYKIIVSKSLLVYNEEQSGSLNYVEEDNVGKLISILTTGNYRSDVEFLYLYRSIIALICSDIDEFSGLISTDLLNYIQHLISEPANGVITNENKANLISGYVVLTLMLHNGSSSFGIDDKITLLMEIAEGYCESATALKKEVESGNREHSTFITDKNLDKKLVNEANLKVISEASVSISAIHGVGCLLTLISRGDFLNELCEDLMFKLVPLLDNDENRDIAKAAGRVIGLIYELYDYSKSTDEDEEEEYNSNAPYYEQEKLIFILTRLLNLSSKKVARKDKKDISSVFRNILNTINVFTDKTKRDQVLKKTGEGLELSQTTIDFSYIKLSKYKSLRINSWFLYLRLRELRWCFSFGLHNQLVANDSIRDTLKEPENEFSYGNHYDEVDDSYLDEENSEILHEYMDQKHLKNEKLRNEKRKKERLVKIGDQLEELNLDT
ncbi:unnamed protein product [Candida verbasci]|uniref:Interferon-related developmental regulator N-terminal domain-containing protein n=1 Tax=Candida verbasci TaxID=1227364 RepID=A0A9W4TUN3_9ASCO|nr:unnamed protein product [Candida verbasci]